MRFLKTLEQQANDAGFVNIGEVRTFETKEMTLNKFNLGKVGEIVEKNGYSDSSCIFLLIRKVPKEYHGGLLACDTCSNGHIIEIYAPT